MDHRIVIIGAGISGLIAAYELEQRGFSPLIIEAGESNGGRVRTTLKDGYCLDHGFQVLLTAYPEARHYLDFEALDLKHFLPGAAIFEGSRRYEISDPLRDWKSLLPMLFSPVGSLGDKLKMLGLSRKLKNKPTEQIFQAESQATIDELKSLGFSDGIIERFFRPFFSGIFLEKDLETSSRMFNFVFKMFSEGSAAIPARGIQAIPDQLASRLKKSEIKYNMEVTGLEDGRIITSEEDIHFDRLVIAMHPGKLMRGFDSGRNPFNESHYFYFTTPSSVIGKAKIGLVPGNGLVNNFHAPTDLHPGFAPEGKHLVSATVVGPRQESDEELEAKVKSELEELTSIPHTPLHSYHIRNALPVIDDMQYSMQPTATRIQDNIFLAGDYNLNPSLNAAMLSGRLAAIAVAEH